MATSRLAADFFYPPKPLFSLPEEAGFGRMDTPPDSPSSSDGTQAVTVILTPSPGSSCASLYPRTKSFSFHSSVDEKTFLVTDTSGVWRVTLVSEAEALLNGDKENVRFNFERLGSTAGDDGELDGPVELYKSCRVELPRKPSRSQSRFSIGHITTAMPARSRSMSSYSSFGSP